MLAADLQAGVEAYDRGDYAAALREFRPLAEQGDGDAQYHLGIMYDSGEGVSEDDAEAVKWYRRAAEQGYAKAQYRLGLKYYFADGVIMGSWDEAVKWWLKAAEQGDADAQYHLGIMYEIGRGVPWRDYTEAVKWWLKAAEQGHAGAQNNLGAMYANGKGVTQSYAEAAKWFRKAAEQGDADAQYHLGVMYDESKGRWSVPQDDAEAAKWYRKAAEQGHVNAQRSLDAIVEQQRREGEEREQQRRWEAEDEKLAQTLRAQRGEELLQLEQAIQAFKQDQCRLDLLLICVPVTQRREGFLWRLTCRDCEQLEVRKSDPLLQDNFSSLMMDLLDMECANLLNSNDFTIPLYDIMERQGVCLRPTLDLTK